MIYHIAIDKKESDRQEALIISREAVLNFENPYSQVTSIGNPVTTGLFSILISLPFSDTRHLTLIFWLAMIAIFYNGVNFLYYGIFLILFIPVSRTMYYQLSEIYFIIPAIYLTKKWWLVLLWRNPLSIIDLSGKSFNPLALVLDYCLIPVFALMIYYNNKNNYEYN
jgi:hypothetical protein